VTQRAVEALVSGVVQGVWFRDFTRTTALGLGLSGYVENLPDGRVHLVASGDPAAVQALLDAVHQGPPRARVDGVEVLDYTGTERFDGFRVRTGSGFSG